MSAHSDCTDLVLSVGFCGEVRLGSLVGLARARQSPLVPIGRVDSAVLPFLTIQAAFRSDESESVFWTGAIGMERLVDSSFCPCRPMKKLTYISPPENSSAAAQPIRAIWSSEALLNNSMSVSFRGKSARLVHHWTKSEDLLWVWQTGHGARWKVSSRLLSCTSERSKLDQSKGAGSNSNGTGFGQITGSTPT